ncbi:MAG TPA: SMEK domain-containing protein [Flavobacterium sp.]|nr:SMEK domain-containing protein [Flavobacterium sp.]
MINSGKQLEEIISMLNNFRSEVQALSALGLLNINKHSENFIKRILNLIYELELESLNDGKSNYPGIDLGDKGESIAFQITATKKSEKIDDTLKTCLKFKHYDTFTTIKTFILTSKQKTYKY